MSSAAIVAPAKGSVWEVLTAPGEQVRRGQELVRVLDCGGALVTATVGESVYDRLRVGSPARFQPRDGGGDLAGTVISLTGSSTTPANFAIEPSALARGAYHVTVSVPGLASAQTCDVGRTGRVVFDGAHADLHRRPAAGALVSPFLASAVECCWPAALVAGAGFAVLPWLKRDSSIARAIVVAIVLALMWRYMLWRWFSTLPPFGFTLDTLTALVFICVETAALVGATISFFFLSRVRDRAAEVEANMGWLTSLPTPPLIDVLICTYNEEEAILEQTIVGALAMDYPNYRLWTLDDGRRPWLEALCERLGCGYITRADNAHAKAGNINNALRRVAALDDAARLRLDPRRRLRADAELPHPRDDAVPRRRRRRGADAAALRQSRPDAAQPVGGAGVAGRAALFLRRHHGVEGRLGRRLLLRHVVDHPLRAADGDRRLSRPTR